MNIEKFINDQLSVWPLACGNFRALRDVRTKRVTVNGLEVILQHNPARIVSSAAKLDAGTLKTRKCFLCRENRPPEQMRLDFEGRKDRKYDILLNPYPIFRNHLVIAMKEHTPQSIWRRYVDMLDLAKALKDYTVFYNGPECGASAPDHHHFQAAPRGLMPLENDMDRLLGMKAGTGECLRPGKLPETGTGARQESETGGLRHIASNLDADLFLYEKYLHGIVIRGATSKSVAKLFYRLLDCAAIDSLSVPVGGTEDSSASNTSLTPAGSTTAEPKCNVFVWYEAGEYRSAVVFRSVHRSHHYFSDGPDHLTMSPGCADMAGCLVVPVAGEFEKIDEASVESLLTEVSLDGNAEKRIVDRLVRSQKEVSVGIMSAPEIVFEIFTDGAGARKAKFRDGKIEYDGSLYDELFFEAKTSSTMFAEPSFRLYGVTIGAGFHWERKEEQLFAGALKIIVDGDKLTAVNMIGIEDYLVSVISSEMKPTAPIEFLKAHAVISRSWVMRMMMHGNAGAAATDPHAEDAADAMTPVVKMDNDSHPAMSLSEAHDNTIEIIRWYDTENHDRFDVCADDHCQRYQGLSRATDPAAKRAVDETWGQVLMSGGEICDARFSKCCGGITEKFSSCWADADYEYLEGGQKCGCGRATPDLLSKVLNSYDLETDDWYRWQVEYGREELSMLFARRSGLETGEIRSMIPLERGVSGRIVKLEITGSEKIAVIGKELEIRRVLSETHLKSSAFDIEYLDAAGNIVPDEAVYAAAGSSARPVFEKIRLKGSGWGHGVGLCQIGAAVMASAGSSYAAILSHYYPNSFLASNPQNFSADNG